MKHPWKTTAIILFLFLVTQYLGLFVLHNSIDTAKTQPSGELLYKDIPSIGPIQIQRPNTTPTGTFWYLISSILIATGLVFLIMRIGANWLWKAWYFYAATILSTITLATFIPGSIAILLGVILAGIKTYRPNPVVHNIVEVLTYPGLALLLVPVLNLTVMSIFVILLSAYDAYAVWHSKHMIKLAKFQLSTKAFAGISIPVGRKQAILGGGDLMIPLLFAGTALKTIPGAWIMPLISGASLLLLFMFAKKGKFYPAIPVLSIGCFVGLFIAWLL